MKGWSVNKIGDVCTLATGGTPSKSKPEYFGGNIKWLVSGDIHQQEIFDCEGRITEAGMRNSNAKLLPVNSVMIALNGQGKTRGSVALLRSQATCNQSLVCISPKSPAQQLLPEFLYAYLYGRYQEIRCMTGDSGNDRRGLNMGLISSIGIPIAPLPEQKRIVGILDEAFEGIATAKTNAEKNLQNARAIFDSHLQSVFTQRGEGWVEKKIREVCTLKSGTSVSTALEKASGDLPYLKVADMSHDGNEIEIFSSSRFLNQVDIGRNAVFPPGTTIFPKRGGAILTNKKRLTSVPICTDLNIMGVIPGKSLLPKFLYFYFLHVDMRRIGSGSSIPQINNYDIEPLVISFPESASQQTEIVCKLEELSTETKRLVSLYQRKLAALEALKKSLLHQAFGGQL